MTTGESGLGVSDSSSDKKYNNEGLKLMSLNIPYIIIIIIKMRKAVSLFLHRGNATHK